jgi:hypothetical protein
MSASFPAVLALTYLAPALELQLRHRTRQFSMVLASMGFVKVSVGLMWSIVFASLPQIAQWLSCSSSCFRMALNVEWLRALVLCAVMVSFVLLLAPLATPAVAFGCVFESGVCVPHSSEQVALGCRTR